MLDDATGRLSANRRPHAARRYWVGSQSTPPATGRPRNIDALSGYDQFFGNWIDPAHESAGPAPMDGRADGVDGGTAVSRHIPAQRGS